MAIAILPAGDDLPKKDILGVKELYEGETGYRPRYYARLSKEQRENRTDKFYLRNCKINPLFRLA
jgi:hypothetical protein